MNAPTEDGYYWLQMSPELSILGPEFGFDPVELNKGMVYKFGIGPGIPIEEGIEDGWEWGPRIEPPAIHYFQESQRQKTSPTLGAERG